MEGGTQTLQLQKLQKREQLESRMVHGWISDEKMKEIERRGMALIPPLNWENPGRGLDIVPSDEDIEAYLKWFFTAMGMPVEGAKDRDRHFARDALMFGLPARWYCFRMVHEEGCPLFYYNFHTGESLWTPPHGLRTHAEAYERLLRYYKIEASAPSQEEAIDSSHEDLISAAWEERGEPRLVNQNHPEPAPIRAVEEPSCSYMERVAKGVGVCMLAGAGLGAVTGVLLMHSAISGAAVGAFSGIGVMVVQQDREQTAGYPTRHSEAPRNAGAEHLPHNPQPEEKTYYTINNGLKTRHSIRENDDASGRIVWTEGGGAIPLSFAYITNGATYHTSQYTEHENIASDTH